MKIFQGLEYIRPEMKLYTQYIPSGLADFCLVALVTASLSNCAAFGRASLAQYKATLKTIIKI